MSIKQDITALAYDKHGRLISVGKNSYTKTHPLQARFSKQAKKPNRIYLHAELDALIRARRRHVYKLVVIRYDANGRPALAKPCPSCQRAIRYFHVDQVEYTE